MKNVFLHYPNYRDDSISISYHMRSLNRLQCKNTVAHNVHSIRHHMYSAFDSLNAPGNGTPIGDLLTGYRIYNTYSNCMYSVHPIENELVFSYTNNSLNVVLK